MKILVPIASLMLASAVGGQSPVLVTPDTAAREGELHLTYDGERAAEVFEGDEALYLFSAFMTETHVEERVTPLHHTEDGDHRATLTIPPEGVYVYLHVVSRTTWDPAASLESMIHDAEGSPVRGARLPAAYNRPDFLAAIAEELQHNPDNYAAYRPKWFLTGVHGSAEEQRAMVREDLPALGDARSPEALWARVYAHMVLGEEEVARIALLELLEDHPRTIATYRAMSDYDYLCYSNGLRVHSSVSEGRRVAIQKNPRSVLAREDVRVVSRDAEFSLTDTIAVCRPWIESQPLDPEPHLVLARKYLETGSGLAEGARHASAALGIYMRGDARLSGDWTGQMTTLMLPGAFCTAVELARARGDLVSAIGFARTGSAVTSSTDARLCELEASLWEELGQAELAETAWGRALDAGSTTARTELVRLTGGTGSTPVGDGELPIAPDFEVVDLRGDEVSLGNLRGRVVVLNFWSLGCAPCKREIPDLNELVERFRGRPVEFVALAGDAREKVSAYLDEQEFLYRNVAQAGRVQEEYGVSALPTHVVIDTEGRRLATLTGASPDQPERIAALIERALERRPDKEGGSSRRD